MPKLQPQKQRKNLKTGKCIKIRDLQGHAFCHIYHMRNQI